MNKKTWQKFIDHCLAEQMLSQKTVEVTIRKLKFLERHGINLMENQPIHFNTTEEGEQKISIKSGRDLAYFIIFATKLLAFHMKYSKKCKAEIEDAIHMHAQAGIDEAIENEPIQITLGVIR